MFILQEIKEANYDKPLIFLSGMIYFKINNLIKIDVKSWSITRTDIIVKGIFIGSSHAINLLK